MTGSTRTLPEFVYHVDPVGSGALVPTDDPCQLCDERTGWRYEGQFFAVEEIECLCPWCISSGRAHAELDIDFGDVEALEPGPDREAVELLLRRTPWHFPAQQEPWPVHCGDFCAFTRRLEARDSIALREELEADVELTASRLELEEDEVRELLRDEGSPLWAFLFTCRHCGVRRFNADFE